MPSPLPRTHVNRSHPGAVLLQNAGRWADATVWRWDTWDNVSVKELAARANVVVAVDDQAWRLVSNLTDAGPSDRAFTAKQTADGGTIVEFGDGVHGAEPPTGSMISVTYQTGAGAGGNAVTVNFERKTDDPTLDKALWVAIRNRTRTVSFNSYRD